MHVLLLAAIAVALAAPAAAQTTGAAQAPEIACRVCHQNRAFLAGKTPTAAGDSALFVSDSLVAGSVHGALPCAACHPGQAEGYPHGARGALSCAACHPSQNEAWEGSSHAANVATRGDAASCVDCHGSHQVYRADDRRASIHPLNVAVLCGSCHADPAIIGAYFMAPEKAQAAQAVPDYYQTVHGSGLTTAGLVVSATCNDCHGAHLILPADSAGSSVHPDHVASTCGGCHVGIDEVYEESAHGVARREGRTTAEGQPAPVCTDCHTAHQIVRADEPQWFIGVVEECGACHHELYERYFETYHGKVTQLGAGLTAKCSDCHTPHANLPATDLRSSVHPVNLVETCAKCHPAANERFAQYYAHGDPRDRERYPRLFWPWLFMITLLGGVFAFFGLHTTLWVSRLAIDRVRGRSAHESEEGG